jgi:hypothetical protein
MIKELAKIVRDLAYFTELGRRNHDEIKELRKSHNDLALSIKLLVLEMERLRENEAHEREKLLLKVENLLARSQSKETPPKQKKLPGK